MTSPLAARSAFKSSIFEAILIRAHVKMLQVSLQLELGAQADRAT